MLSNRPGFWPSQAPIQSGNGGVAHGRPHVCFFSLSLNPKCVWETVSRGEQGVVCSPETRNVIKMWAKVVCCRPVLDISNSRKKHVRRHGFRLVPKVAFWDPTEISQQRAALPGVWCLFAHLPCLEPLFPEAKAVWPVAKQQLADENMSADQAGRNLHRIDMFLVHEPKIRVVETVRLTASNRGPVPQG
jgi:hypothetical protein